jgi:hypothetical protein
LAASQEGLSSVSKQATYYNFVFVSPKLLSIFETRVLRYIFGPVEECVWQDIRIFGVRNWRSVASNTEEWRTILRKARAHIGLSANDDDDDDDDL